MIKRKALLFEGIQNSLCCIELPEETSNITTVVLNDLYCLILTEAGEVWKVGEFNMYNPTFKTFLDKNNRLAWQASPMKINELSLMKVSMISCSSNIIHALTTNGLVYSWGSDNKNTGLLGLGSIRQQGSPTLINALSNKKVKYINCGQKHAAAIDSWGNLYLWGSGKNGELGVTGIEKILEPVEIKCPELLNTRLTLCHKSCTTILTMGGQVFFLGTLGSMIFEEQSTKENTSKLAFDIGRQQTVSVIGKSGFHSPRVIKALQNDFVQNVLLQDSIALVLLRKGDLICVTSQYETVKLYSSGNLKSVVINRFKVFGTTSEEIIEWDLSSLLKLNSKSFDVMNLSFRTHKINKMLINPVLITTPESSLTAMIFGDRNSTISKELAIPKVVLTHDSPERAEISYRGGERNQTSFNILGCENSFGCPSEKLSFSFEKKIKSQTRIIQKKNVQSPSFLDKWKIENKGANVKNTFFNLNIESVERTNKFLKTTEGESSFNSSLISNRVHAKPAQVSEIRNKILSVFNENKENVNTNLNSRSELLKMISSNHSKSQPRKHLTERDLSRDQGNKSKPIQSKKNQRIEEQPNSSKINIGSFNWNFPSLDDIFASTEGQENFFMNTISFTEGENFNNCDLTKLNKLNTLTSVANNLSGIEKYRGPIENKAEIFGSYFNSFEEAIQNNDRKNLEAFAKRQKNKSDFFAQKVKKSDNCSPRRGFDDSSDTIGRRVCDRTFFRESIRDKISNSRRNSSLERLKLDKGQELSRCNLRNNGESFFSADGKEEPPVFLADERVKGQEQSMRNKLTDFSNWGLDGEFSLREQTEKSSVDDDWHKIGGRSRPKGHSSLTRGTATTKPLNYFISLIYDNPRQQSKSIGGGASLAIDQASLCPSFRANDAVGTQAENMVQVPFEPRAKSFRSFIPKEKLAETSAYDSNEQAGKNQMNPNSENVIYETPRLHIINRPKAYLTLNNSDKEGKNKGVEPKIDPFEERKKEEKAGKGQDKDFSKDGVSGITDEEQSIINNKSQKVEEIRIKMQELFDRQSQQNSFSERFEQFNKKFGNMLKAKNSPSKKSILNSNRKQTGCDRNNESVSNRSASIGILTNINQESLIFQNSITQESGFQTGPTTPCRKPTNQVFTQNQIQNTPIIQRKRENNTNGEKSISQRSLDGLRAYNESMSNVQAGTDKKSMKEDSTKKSSYKQNPVREGVSVDCDLPHIKKIEEINEFVQKFTDNIINDISKEMDLSMKYYSPQASRSNKKPLSCQHCNTTDKENIIKLGFDSIIKTQRGGASSGLIEGEGNRNEYLAPSFMIGLDKINFENHKYQGYLERSVKKSTGQGKGMETPIVTRLLNERRAEGKIENQEVSRSNEKDGANSSDFQSPKMSSICGQFQGDLQRTAEKILKNILRNEKAETDASVLHTQTLNSDHKQRVVKTDISFENRRGEKLGTLNDSLFGLSPNTLEQNFFSKKTPKNDLISLNKSKILSLSLSKSVIENEDRSGKSDDPASKAILLKVFPILFQRVNNLLKNKMLFAFEKLRTLDLTKKKEQKKKRKATEKIRTLFSILLDKVLRQALGAIRLHQERKKFIAKGIGLKAVSVGFDRLQSYIQEQWINQRIIFFKGLLKIREESRQSELQHKKEAKRIDSIQDGENLVNKIQKLFKMRKVEAFRSLKEFVLHQDFKQKQLLKFLDNFQKQKVKRNLSWFIFKLKTFVIYKKKHYVDVMKHPRNLFVLASRMIRKFKLSSVLSTWKLFCFQNLVRSHLKLQIRERNEAGRTMLRVLSTLRLRRLFGAFGSLAELSRKGKVNAKLFMDKSRKIDNMLRELKFRLLFSAFRRIKNLKNGSLSVRDKIATPRYSNRIFLCLENLILHRIDSAFSSIKSNEGNKKKAQVQTSEYMITFSTTPQVSDSKKKSLQSPRFKQYLDKAFSSQEFKRDSIGGSSYLKKDSASKEQSTKTALETGKSLDLDGQMTLSRVLNKEGVLHSFGDWSKALSTRRRRTPEGENEKENSSKQLLLRNSEDRKIQLVALTEFNQCLENPSTRDLRKTESIKEYEAIENRVPIENQDFKPEDRGRQLQTSREKLEKMIETRFPNSQNTSFRDSSRDSLRRTPSLSRESHRNERPRSQIFNQLDNYLQLGRLRSESREKLIKGAELEEPQHNFQMVVAERQDRGKEKLPKEYDIFNTRMSFDWRQSLLEQEKSVIRHHNYYPFDLEQTPIMRRELEDNTNFLDSTQYQSRCMSQINDLVDMVSPSFPNERQNPPQNNNMNQYPVHRETPVNSVYMVLGAQNIQSQSQNQQTHPPAQSNNHQSAHQQQVMDCEGEKYLMNPSSGHPVQSIAEEGVVRKSPNFEERNAENRADSNNQTSIDLSRRKPKGTITIDLEKYVKYKSNNPSGEPTAAMNDVVIPENLKVSVPNLNVDSVRKRSILVGEKEVTLKKPLSLEIDISDQRISGQQTSSAPNTKRANGTKQSKFSETARVSSTKSTSRRDSDYNVHNSSNYLKKPKSRSPVASLNGSLSKINTSLSSSSKKEKSPNVSLHKSGKRRSLKNAFEKEESSFHKQIYNQIQSDAQTDKILKEKIVQRLMTTGVTKNPLQATKKKGLSYFNKMN